MEILIHSISVLLFIAFANNCLYFILRGKATPNLEAQESYFNLASSGNLSPRSSSTPGLYQLKRSATSGDFSILSDTSDEDGTPSDRTHDVKSAASTDRQSQPKSRASVTLMLGQDYLDNALENELEEYNNEQV